MFNKKLKNEIMEKDFANIEIKRDSFDADSKVPPRGSIRIGLGLFLTSEDIKKKRKILDIPLP